MGLPNFTLVSENDTIHSIGTGRGIDFVEKERVAPNFSKFLDQGQ
jgi:hypothetical protein